MLFWSVTFSRSSAAKDQSMSSKFVANLAVEMWRANGLRTRERLASLVSSLSSTYALPSDAQQSAQDLASAQVRPWELAK